MVDLSQLGLTPLNRERLEVLIESEDDYHDFMNNFWEGVQRQGFAVSYYHEAKVARRNMSLEEFVSMFEVDRKKALRQLFLLPINAFEVSSLNRKLSDGYSLASLYQSHQNEPTARLLHFVL